MSLYLLSLLLLHLSCCFMGCQFGSGINERFPLISITSVVPQLSFYPEGWMHNSKWLSKCHIPVDMFWKSTGKHYLCFFVYSLLWLTHTVKLSELKLVHIVVNVCQIFFLTESNHSCKPHGNWQENVPSCLLQQHEFDMKTLYTVSLFKSFFKFNVLLSKFATSHATQSSIYIDALCEERPVVTLLQLWRKLQTWLIWSEKLLGLTWAMCVGAAISKDEARGTAWPDLAHQSCHARKRGLAYPLTWWKLPLNVT